jgi:uncharacterized membrane protein
MAVPTPIRLVDRLEAAQWPDRLADVYRPLANAVAGPAEGGRNALLTGSWLGHAVHPILVQLPLGMWLSTTVLDLTGGVAARPAARKLLGLGVLATIPAVASGLAEWRQTAGGSRRVGLVHAAANTVGTTLMGISYLTRRMGGHGGGVLLTVAGNAAAGVAGYLGGHLTIVKQVASGSPVALTD